MAACSFTTAATNSRRATRPGSDFLSLLKHAAACSSPSIIRLLLRQVAMETAFSPYSPNTHSMSLRTILKKKEEKKKKPAQIQKALLVMLQPLATKVFHKKRTFLISPVEAHTHTNMHAPPCWSCSRITISTVLEGEEKRVFAIISKNALLFHHFCWLDAG